MAVALNKSASAQASSTTTVACTLTSVPADDVIVVAVNAEGTSPQGGAFTVSSVAATGLTFTHRGSSSGVTSGGGSAMQRTETWFAVVPFGGFTGSITATFSHTIDDATIHAFSVTGADTTTPFRDVSSTTANHGSTNTAMQVAFTADTGDFLFAAGGSEWADFTGSPLSGFTTISSVVNGGGLLSESGAVVYQIPSGSFSANVGWSTSNQYWTIVADALVPAGGGAVSASVTGVVAAATATGVAGTATAERDSAATGVAAALAEVGVAGSTTAAVAATAAGVAAAATVTGVAGSVTSEQDSAVTGTTATEVAAGRAGTVTAVALEIPPTLRSSPTYTYLLADLLTNEIIEEISFKGVSFTQVLNGAGDFKGSVVLSDFSNKKSRVIPATVPGRTALYVDRGGVLVWGGVVWGRRYTSTDNLLEIDATEFWSYFRRRRIGTASYSATDQFAIATGLIDTAQGETGGDIGVLLPDPGSGGVNRDCVYYSYQRKPVAEAVEDMAGLEDGFDFRIAVKWDAGVPTKTFIPRIRHWTYDVEVDTGVPINSRRMFELPGNLRDYEWDDDASTLATSFTVAGSGSGAGLTTETKLASTKLSDGWPLLEGELIFPDLTDDAAVTARAQAEMDIHKIGRTMPQFNVRGDMDPLLGTYHVGQTCRVRITDPRFPQTKDVVFPAITAIEFNPADEQNDEYAAISVAVENPTGGDGA